MQSRSKPGQRLGSGLAACLAALLTGAAESRAAAADDAGVVPSFKEGDVIGLGDVEKLKPFLPAEFWDNRDFFFYEGMQLQIGPTQADYSGSEQFENATRRFAGQARIGPDDSLENYTAGRPFPMDQIDCAKDPQAGAKIMWNFQSGGGDGHASFFYSYWDRGEQLPLYYEGTGQSVKLAHRIEPEYLDTQGGDLFRGEKRKGAFGAEVVGALRRPRHPAAHLPLQGQRQAARRWAQRRHLGLRADAAPRAPHLDRAAHGRDLRHRLHVRRPAQLQRHRAPVRMEVHRQAQADRPDEHARSRPIPT